MSKIKDKVIPVSCNKDCGGGCALHAFVRDGGIVSIKDSAYKPEYMRGCIKGYRMADALYSSDRLVRPLLRKGDRGSGEFEEISWEEALDIVSGKLAYYRGEFGASSIMRIGGSGSCRGALHNTAVLAQRFLGLLGGYTETTGNFSSEASDFVKPFMFGTKYIGIDVKTLFDSELIVLWGMNPEETRMGAETEYVLKKISEKGIPFAVVDPRKTASVRKYGGQWFPVLPGTDSALMLAVLFITIRDSKIDYDYIEKYSTGFSSLEDYITGRVDGIAKTPRWAEGICGLSSNRIEEFADLYTGRKPATILSGLSVQRTIGGENVDRLGAVLQLASGNFGIPGGSPGCGQWNKIPSVRCGKISSYDNPDIKKVPVYLWADAVLEGTEGGYPSDIRVLYNVGGNYIGQGSDTRKTVAAFEKAGFVVTHDYFLTPSAVYSDIVLPAATFLERSDIVFSNSKYLFYSEKVCDPIGASKTDYEIFSMLSSRLGFYDEFTENRTETEWLDYFIDNSEIPDTAEFKLKGIYQSSNQQYIGLSDFFKDPEKYPLSTPSGKIEITIGEFGRLGGTEAPEAVIMQVSGEYPLRLITPHEKYRIHSQFDNIPEFRKLTDKTLWINVKDAEERGISDSDLVRITSSAGSLRAYARVTRDISPGAVSLNQGSWITFYDEPNPNALTSTVPAMPSKGSRTHSTAVQVERS